MKHIITVKQVYLNWFVCPKSSLNSGLYSDNIL